MQPFATTEETILLLFRKKSYFIVRTTEKQANAHCGRNVPLLVVTLSDIQVWAKVGLQLFVGKRHVGYDYYNS
jgi:hypothetical protein